MTPPYQLFSHKSSFPKNQRKKLMPILSSYVLTLNKKKIFFSTSPTKKIKGGGISSKLEKKQVFSVWQKFLAEISADRSKNWPSKNFGPRESAVFLVCKLDKKQKSYAVLKLGDSKFWKTPFTPPFKMNVPDSAPNSWHVKYLQNFLLNPQMHFHVEN